MTSTEKETVLGLCRSVPRLLRKLKPNKQIKTHMIEFEVHDFIQEWGTLGILNEEAFESIHAHINGMVRRFVCMRNRVHRDTLMKKNFDVMQATKSKTEAMVEARKRPRRESAPATL